MSDIQNNDDVKTEVEETSLVTRIKNKLRTNQSSVLLLGFAIPVFSAFFYPFLTGQFTGTGYYLLSFTLVFLFAAMTLSLNLEVGYLGLPNFGKVAFIAIGGYTFALARMESISIPNSLLLSIIVTAIFGAVLTIPTLRLREEYLAIVTIVAGEMLRFIAFNQEELGGFEGIRVDNPVHLQFDTQQVIGGYYLQFNTFLITIGVILVGHFLYYYIHRRQEGDDINRNIGRSTHRVLTYATIMAITVIALDYFKVIPTSLSDLRDILFAIFGFGEMPQNDSPTVSLHYFLILFIVTLVVYQSIKNFIATKIPGFNKLDAHRGIDLIFAINYLLVILNYLKGLSINNDFYQLRVFRLFTTIDPIRGNYTYEPHYTVIPITIIVINWFSMLVALFTLVIVYMIMEEIYYSPFGRTLRAIREDDTSATSVGKNIFAYRLRALIIASGLAGFTGAMYVAITPIQANSQSYVPLLTFQLYIYLIVGGTGNNKGAIFGATIMVLLERVTKGTFVLDAKLWDTLTYPDGSRIDPINVGLVLAGTILVIFLIYAPAGIIPEKKYNNQRYYDILAYTDEERAEDDKLLAALITLSGTQLETEDWL